MRTRLDKYCILKGESSILIMSGITYLRFPWEELAKLWRGHSKGCWLNWVTGLSVTVEKQCGDPTLGDLGGCFLPPRLSQQRDYESKPFPDKQVPGHHFSPPINYSSVFSIPTQILLPTLLPSKTTSKPDYQASPFHVLSRYQMGLWMSSYRHSSALPISLLPVQTLYHLSPALSSVIHCVVSFSNFQDWEDS